MNLGFKVQPRPLPRVLAGEGQVTCGKSPQDNGKAVYCERPIFHDGGHLSQSQGRYWQQEES